MRVRAVPGLGDRYVGSVECLGEGLVLVGVEAKGWGSDRSMVCHELHDGRPPTPWSSGLACVARPSWVVESLVSPAATRT